MSAGTIRGLKLPVLLTGLGGSFALLPPINLLRAGLLSHTSNSLPLPLIVLHSVRSLGSGVLNMIMNQITQSIAGNNSIA